jgi:hypothetical protein
LAWSVTTIDPATARAGFARVAGIDIERRHTSQSCFIGDELAELAERSVVQPLSLATAGLKPVRDMG